MDDDGSPGVPEWVVTYGDMMSLLLTFFIMLVSLSEVVADEKYRAILDALQRYTGYRSAPAGPPGDNFPLNSLIAQLESLGSFTEAERARGGIKTEALSGPDMRVLRTREGVDLLVGRPIPFQAESVELSAAAKDVLTSISEELGGLPHKVDIRGYATPESGRSLSESRRLSYERSRAVLELLRERGVSMARMRITLAADTETKTAGNGEPQSGDRVEVRMLDAYAEEFVGPREAVH